MRSCAPSRRVPLLPVLLLRLPVPARPAGGPAPGDLALEVRVDEKPLFLDAAAKGEAAVVFTVGRTEKGPSSGTLRVGKEGSPSLPFEFDRARKVELRASLPLPAAEGGAAVHPLELRSGGTRLLAMDLRLARTAAWRVVGPFPGGVEASHDRDFAPEWKTEPDATFPVEGGKPISWADLPGSTLLPDGSRDLGAFFEGRGGITAYVETRFRADGPCRARLLLGSDDSLRAWWNGRRVLDRKVRRGCRPGEDAVEVDLEKGENHLLLKICQDGGAFAFAASLDDGKGGPVPGVVPLTRVERVRGADSRPRPVAVGRTSAVLSWTTDDPVSSRVLLLPAKPGRARPVPPGTAKGHMVAAPFGAVARIVEDPFPCTDHRLSVEGLEPGTRYILSVPAGPGPQGKGEGPGPLSFRTEPPEGKQAVIRLRVAVVIFTAAVPAADAGREGARTPAPAAKVEEAKARCEAASAFFFRNSGMRLWLDNEILVDDTFHAIPEGAPYGVGLAEGAPHEKALRRLLAARNEVPQDYDALAYATLARRFDGTGWTYEFSGGGTYGPDGPFGVGNSSWKGGHDNAWLYVHEVGHQVDALYEASGMPEFLFNHFQPWDGTAHRHGEHYDGNAWLLREWAGIVTREHPGWPPLPPSLGFRWGTCRFGDVLLVDDGDGDGVPAAAPELPLDEARLGSDPAKRDTDGDGLDDLGEALSVIGAEEGLQESWAGPPESHRCDPRNPDSDGDGIRDGDDPEPTCALPAMLPRGTVVLDGRVRKEEGGALLRIDERGFHASFRLSRDGEALHVSGSIESPFEEVRVLLDADDDGWFVGRDNLDLRFDLRGLRVGPEWRVQAEGKFAAALHNAGVPGKWPFYDPEGLAPDSVAFATADVGGRREFEIALRRDPGLGLDLVAGERMGIAVSVRPGPGVLRPGAEGSLTLFEPHRFFRFALGE